MFMYWNFASIEPQKIRAFTIFDTRKVPSDILHPPAELITVKVLSILEVCHIILTNSVF